jgi:hypothetical protein
MQFCNFFNIRFPNSRYGFKQITGKTTDYTCLSDTFILAEGIFQKKNTG